MQSQDQTDILDPQDIQDILTESNSEETVAKKQPEEVKIQSKPFEKHVSVFSTEEPLRIDDFATASLFNTKITIDEFISGLDNLSSSLKKAEKNQAGLARLESLSDAFQTYQNAALGISLDTFHKFFEENPERLSQVIVGTDNKKIRISTLNTSIASDDSIQLSGEDATNFIFNVTRMGSVVTIPLWHSGYVIKISPFSETELVDLNYKLLDTQLTIGVATKGAIFSGDDVFIVSAIIDLIIEHIIDANVKYQSLEQVRKHFRRSFSVRDIPALLTGGLLAIYPDGYPVFHPCVNTAKVDSPCDYTVTALKTEEGDFLPDSKIDFRKVYFVDKSKITTKDIIHMSSTGKNNDHASIIDFQSRLSDKLELTNKRWLILANTLDKSNCDIYTVFKSPTYSEYIAEAYLWLNTVDSLVGKKLQEEAFGSRDEQSKKRTRYLNSIAEVTELKKHTPWVEYLVFDYKDGREVTIKDRNAIANSLESLNGKKDFKINFEKAMQEYKETSIMAWTGVQNFECPVCKAGQTDSLSVNPTLIPVNMVGYFFSIMALRAQTKQMYTQ